MSISGLSGLGSYPVSSNGYKRIRIVSMFNSGCKWIRFVFRAEFWV